MRNKNRSKMLLGLIVLVLFVCGIGVIAQDAPPAAEQSLPSIIEVSGRVSDASGSPLANAIVKAVGTDVSAVLTDARGVYKFYLVGQKAAFTLRVCKEGYIAKSSKPTVPEETSARIQKVKFDASLKKVEKKSVEVVMERFVSGVSISGKVTGLKAEDVAKHKVVVYVLTDKWYIHPYAENKDGKGYASIKADGSWNILTVSRKHNPFRLAILVVPMDCIPAAAILPGEDAEVSLRAKFGKNLVAAQIQKAPEGL